MEFKALIAAESSWRLDRATGLLQFTGIGIADVNQKPGNLKTDEGLGRDFVFTEPTKPEQAIPAGVRALERAKERLTDFFDTRGGNPTDFKRMHLASYNVGSATMKRALQIAHDTTGKPFNQLTFDDLTFAGEVPAFVTPLFKAMDAFRGSFIKKTDPESKLEARFFIAEDYPRRVLAIAGTNAP